MKKHNTSHPLTKALLLSALLLNGLCAPLAAQNSQNMPYSMYGSGVTDLPQSMPWAAACGGAVLTRSADNQLNAFNPATFANIKPQSFVFNLELSLNQTRLSDAQSSSRDFEGTLSSLTIGFPITKWWKTSLGIIPFGNKSYQSVKYQNITGASEPVKTIFDGNGGISTLYWGHGFNIIGGTDPLKPALSAGMNVKFLFGNYACATTYDFVNNDTTFFADTRYQRSSALKHFAFDFGLYYRQPLGEQYALRIGAYLQPAQAMKLKEESLAYTFGKTTTQEYIIDTIFPQRGKEVGYESNLDLPLSVGIGIALENTNHWTVAFDANYAQFSGTKYKEGLEHSLFGTDGCRYNSTYRLALGGGWDGNPESSKYLARVSYTGGVYYHSAKLSLDLADAGLWSLDEWGIGIGINFPMRRGRSHLLLSACYSNFGTTDLLRREMLSFGISISGVEQWFMKRKYN